METLKGIGWVPQGFGRRQTKWDQTKHQWHPKGLCSIASPNNVNIVVVDPSLAKNNLNMRKWLKRLASFLHSLHGWVAGKKPTCWRCVEVNPRRNYTQLHPIALGSFLRRNSNLGVKYLGNNNDDALLIFLGLLWNKLWLVLFDVRTKKSKTSLWFGFCRPS